MLGLLRFEKGGLSKLLRHVFGWDVFNGFLFVEAEEHSKWIINSIHYIILKRISQRNEDEGKCQLYHYEQSIKGFITEYWGIEYICAFQLYRFSIFYLIL